ncbi:LysM peptidoglycan-binding domain-containing protein [Brevibacillus sp. SYSU BS000544]|uniref:LysM peptidoglycan-binding domain-containing protein n=1 Tax=Brevibacillus sp. SYSU BS000544 TaxID=3416443 RepID=UPI003CE4FEB0
MNYVVQPGDTLFSIANRFGVDWQEIVRVNRLRPPFILFVGQTLQIPGIGPRPPRPPVPESVDRRLDRLERQVNRLDERVDRLERRVTRLEQQRPR